jgi:6,7-dimethyl-8-ribityllumazine synthase
VRTEAGRLDAAGLRAAVVVSRFNSFITERLLAGALDTLVRMGAEKDDLAVHWVPGAMEIPALARTLARSGEHDAVVCLGAVIRGGTAHYDHVCLAAVGGVAEVALEAEASGVVVTSGIVTTESLEQAIDRAGGKAGNKGADAAAAAAELVDLRRRIGHGRPAAKGPR